MKKLKWILLLILFAMTIVGLIFRIHYWSGGEVLLTFGLFGTFIYFSTKTIKDIANKKNHRLNLLLKILIILMSLILFSKYLHHRFADYPGVFIIPFFVIVSLLYLFRAKYKEIKLSVTSVLFLILTIPLFGIDFPIPFDKTPRNYIPNEWYNRFDVEEGETIKLPYEFEYKKTEQLSSKAFTQLNSDQYYDALLNFKKAIKLEPNNPTLLFGMSGCYASVNDLETAIEFLNKAIEIDDKNPAFYNNRGLIYYKLKNNEKAITDYKNAINLDSTNSIYYANLALVYYYEDSTDKACQMIKNAERLGFEINDKDILMTIKKRNCK